MSALTEISESPVSPVTLPAAAIHTLQDYIILWSSILSRSWRIKIPPHIQRPRANISNWTTAQFRDLVESYEDSRRADKQIEVVYKRINNAVLAALDAFEQEEGGEEEMENLRRLLKIEANGTGAGNGVGAGAGAGAKARTGNRAGKDAGGGGDGEKTVV